MMFLESMGPMNFLGSQALHVMTPIIECAFDGKTWSGLPASSNAGISSRG